MAFFSDLSPYSYINDEASPGLLNVGWLSKNEPFARGPVSGSFVRTILKLCESPTNLCRGTHICEFCQPPRDILKLDEDYYWVWALAREGNGEIHVPAEDGVTYVAPALVAHYIMEHQYQPPQKFIDAVLRLNAIKGA
jgi:hypothetical protein